jgi:hypothetical protein
MPGVSVFISHSSKDDGIVKELQQALELRGIVVWVDSEELSGGDPLSPKIHEAIENADHFLVLVSMDALNSAWVQREVAHARTIHMPGYKIIPLIRPGIGIPLLRLLMGEEPVAIQLTDGPAAVAHALPQILAALGLQLPTEITQPIHVETTPVADLIL